MSWQVLIIISILLYSITTLLQRVFLKNDKINPVLFAILFQFSTGIFIGIFGLFFGDVYLPNIQPLWINLFFMTVLYGLANIFMYKALQHIEASRFAIIFSSRTLFTILASSFLLKESLTLQQFGGTLFILAGITLVNVGTKTFTFGKKEFFVLIAAICFGFGLTNDRILLKSFTVYPYAFINLLFPTIFLGLFNISRVKEFSLFFQTNFFGKMTLMSFLYAISVVTFFSALQKSSNSSQISAIGTISVVVTVILAIIFLKERENMSKKIIGSVVSFVGLVLLNS